MLQKLFTRIVATMLIIATTHQSVLAQDNPDYRLTNLIKPTQQFIELALNPRDESYQGNTIIDLHLLSETSEIILHSREHDISKAMLMQGAKKITALTVTPYTLERIKLQANQTLTSGEYQLHLSFTGKYSHKSVGLYKTTEQQTDYLFTQFEMSDARGAFPSFDEPEFKLPFQMTIHAPASDKVFYNTPELNQKPSHHYPGWIEHTFAATPPISSYLVAFAVGPLETYPIEGMSIPGNIITTKGKIEKAKYAALQAPKILKFMEDYFGGKYPFQKLDLVALPEFPFGAMENPGLITFREDILLVDENSSAQAKTGNVMVIGHEIAHMWYGDLVTMKWWNNLWLNEAFASWMATKSVITLYPEMEYHLRLPQNKVMGIDSLATAKPIRKEIRTEADIMDGLHLAYSKGESVLTMIERWIGEEAFQKGVQNYMQKHAWSNTEASDLWNALAKSSGKPVPKTLESFISYAGFPLLSVDVQGNKVTLTQTPYIANANNDIWALPVSIQYGNPQKKQTETLLLTKSSQTFELAFAPDWLHPDAAATGYYRWTMPESQLQRLAEAANTHLSPKERIAYIANMQTLLRKNLIAAPVFLDALKAFANDSHPRVVSEVVTQLFNFSPALITANNEASWRPYLNQLMQPQLMSLGLKENAQDTSSTQRLRADIIKLLGIIGANKQLIATAQKKTQEYLKDPQSVEASLTNAWLAVAVYHGDKKLLTQIINSAKNVTDASVRTALLDAVASANGNTQAAAMQFLLSDTITASDMRHLLKRFSFGEARQQQLQAWFISNYAEVKQKLPPFAISLAPDYVGSSCTLPEFERLNDFYQKDDSLNASLKRALTKLKDKVNDCEAFRASQLNSVEKYLKSLN